MAARTENSKPLKSEHKYTQVYNASTDHYLKIDTITGRITEVNYNGKPFKGVLKRKSIVKFNPCVKKRTAVLAEKAVIFVRNSSLCVD